MVLPNDIRLVLTTPETTLLDEPVRAVRLPLYDGQLGILPGRAPLIGRLGYGELKITTDADERSYYVDGGFVQVKGPVVSILTNRALPARDLSETEANARLQEASARPAVSDADYAAKERELERARRMATLARRAH